MERDDSNKGPNLDSLPLIGLENYNRLDDLIEQYSVPLNILSALANSFYNKPKIWTKNSKNSEFAVL